MNAIEVQNTKLVYTQVPKPVPHADDVLIRVKAIGVNRPDLFQAQGLYDPPSGASPLLGLEVSGIIEETGEKICALLEGGGYAQFAIARRTQCLPLPKGLSFEEAAALPECVFTVWKNIFIHGRFKEGETVLIHGGTSGIGTTAIQMIKAFGGSSLVTCATDKKCKAALKLGAVKAINYNSSNFLEETLAHTNGAGVDIVLDMVGGDYVQHNLKCLKAGGRHVSIAFLHGAKAELLIPLLMKKQLTITGSMLRPAAKKEKAALTQEIIKQIWPKIESGQISPIIHRSFPLKEAGKAHTCLKNSEVVGKIILIP